MNLDYSIMDEDDGEEPTLLREYIGAIFADSYKTTTGHRKLVVRLRKCLEQCCYAPEELAKKSKKNGGERALIEYDEEDFVREVKRCVIRILGVKKTEGAGEKMVRFLGLFLRESSERDIVLVSGGEELEGALPETPTSRLTFQILSMLIPLLSAKEKMVRFRATQVISHVINSLESIDDELYHLIRQGLIKRIRDKEPSIRIQAIMGLGRLAGNEAEEGGQNNGQDSDDDDIEGSGGSSALLEKLLDALQHDTSAEVRRSLLLNLPLTPATLPYLLERARDLDAATRRALYARLLPTLGDFRHLSLSMREKLLRWGMRDRDENVRKAAGRLFRERWIEDCAASHRPQQEEQAEDGQQQKPQDKVADPSIPALLELLERIDVVNSGVEDGIALEAMTDFWDGRPDYLDAINFDDDFWSNLTPESAFVVRSFNDFLSSQQQQGEYKYAGLAEEKMPEVTKLGFYLQKYLNGLLDTIKRAAAEGRGADEDDETVEQEFIVEQLLHMALTLDYTDEIGRRKMFSLLREALAMADLPDEVTRLSIEVLRLVCGEDAAAEKEFCEVVLEAIAEVHDNIAPAADEAGEEDESFVSARSEVSGSVSPSRSKKTGSSGRSDASKSTGGEEEDEEKAIREIMINMKCLHIAQCMLQNVDGNLQQNMSLVTMLNNLVVPAVRSHEAPIRERGLVCLGLCCLLDRILAEENITLFIHCFSKGHEALQVTSLQILCDILVTHPTLLSPTEPQDGEEEASVQVPAHQKALLKVFTRALKPSGAASPVQAAAATSLSKLLLTSRLLIPSGSLDDMLCVLVSSFFNPATADNPALRQALAYFLPVYSHSRLENCERMARVAVGVIHTVMNAADEYYSLEAEEDSDGDVDESKAEKQVKALMGIVVGMLAEWTDGRKVVSLGGAEMDGSGEKSTGKGEMVQMAVAAEALERILASNCQGQERKYLLTLLSKLYIPTPASTSTSPPTSSHGMLTTSEQKEEEQRQLRIRQLELATNLKPLLDEAIAEGVASDATGRNALVKVKNSILKLIKLPEAAAKGRVGALRMSTASAITMPIRRSGGARSTEDEDLDEVEEDLREVRQGVVVEETAMDVDEEDEL